MLKKVLHQIVFFLLLLSLESKKKGALMDKEHQVIEGKKLRCNSCQEDFLNVRIFSYEFFFP
jgi:hypothetical protein